LHNFRRLILVIVFVGVSAFSAYSQDMLGLANSNFAGAMGISLNPSSMVGSKLYMDYNLIGFNVSVDNSYAYIEKGDFYDLIFKGIEPVYYTSKHEKRNFAYYDNDKLKNGYVDMKITGPGAMLVYGKHAFGLTTSYRTLASFNNLPPDVATFLYEAIDYPPQQMKLYSHDKPIKGSFLSWLEIGVSYSYLIHRKKWEFWSLGITLKPLFGYSGLYMAIDNVDYMIENDSTAHLQNTSFKYGYSLPVDYTNNDFTGGFKRGFGFGADIGVTYEKTRKGHGNGYFSRLCEQRYDSYNYKIGFSILDFGYIRFTKNAEDYSYNDASAYWYEPDDTLPNSSMNEINTKIRSYFGDPAGVSTKFSMYLPMAVSLQYDYWMWKGFYLNGTLIYGFKFGDASVKRPTILAITPRWEKVRYEFSFPISFYEWDPVPKIGFSIRYGGFYIGSENLNPLLKISDFTGLNLYFGMRLNLMRLLRMDYWKGNCDDLRMRDIETFDYRNF